MIFVKLLVIPPWILQRCLSIVLQGWDFRFWSLQVIYKSRLEASPNLVPPPPPPNHPSPNKTKQNPHLLHPLTPTWYSFLNRCSLLHRRFPRVIIIKHCVHWIWYGAAVIVTNNVLEIAYKINTKNMVEMFHIGEDCLDLYNNVYR